MLAAIAGAHGVGGEVRLKLFADSIDSLRRHRDVFAGGAALTLRSVREGPGGAIARFAEITDRDAAERLRGLELTVPRSALPPPEEGEVYIADLIGLPVTAGGPAGVVTGVENHGAGDLVEIERLDGRRILVPFAQCELGPEGLSADPIWLE